MYEQHGVLEKYITQHKGAYYNKCDTCEHEFKVGENKYKWRLGLPTSTNYLRGQFWTQQCRECLITTKQRWIQSLEELQI